MKKHIAAIAALVIVCNLAACMAGTTLRSRQRYVANHHNLTPDVRQAILGGTIIMDMTEDQVAASLGPPNHVNRSTYSWGTTTQFCYDEIGFNFNFNRYRYVYFENGRVTSWQQ